MTELEELANKKMHFVIDPNSWYKFKEGGKSCQINCVTFAIFF